MNVRLRRFAVAVFSLCAAQAVAADAGAKPIRIASPGFTAVNLDAKVADFFSDHFAQQLALKGIAVVSSSEVQTLIGMERQKQLMGCGENSSSCVAELANALGADGVITGSVGKFGNSYRANIKILAASNGSALSILSRKAASDDELLDALTDAADVAAFDLKDKLRPGTAEAPPVSTGRGSPNGSSTSNNANNVNVVEDPEKDRHNVAEAPPVLGPKRVPKYNALHFNAAALIWGEFNLEYERTLVGGLTLSLGGRYMLAWLGGQSQVMGIGALRYFFSGEGINGFGLGLGITAGYNFFSEANEYGVQLQALYNLHLGENLVVGVGVNAVATYVDVLPDGDLLSGFALRGAVGYRF